MDTTVIANEGSDDGTYFQDERGRYYFMPKQPLLITPITTNTLSPSEETTHSDDVKILTIPPEDEDSDNTFLMVIQQPEQLSETDAPIMIEENDFYYENCSNSREHQYHTQVTIEDDSKHVIGFFENDDNAKEKEGMRLKSAFEQEQQTLAVTKADQFLSSITRNLDPKNREDISIKDTVEKQIAVNSKAGLFACPHCAYTTSLRYMMKRHEITHTDELNFKCMDCNRRFKTMRSLKTHSTIHTDKKLHRCKHCKKKFKRGNDLKRHTLYKHDQKKKCICLYCGLSFVESYKLKLHIISKHNSSNGPTFKCQVCSYSSNIEYSVKRHMKIHTSIKQHRCQYCDMSFSRPVLLKNHLTRIHNKVEKVFNFSCNHCSAVCRRKDELIVHIRKMHTINTPIKCRICCKSFPDKYTFKVHNEIHKGERHLKCSVCSYATETHRQMILHFNKVHGQHSFHCNECEKIFTAKWSIARHWHSSHNPKNIYNCNYCKKSFKNRSSLARHIKAHKNDNTKRKTRTMKQRIASSKFDCEECGNTFSRKFSLTRHITLVHQNKRLNLVCQHCDKKFSKMGTFKRHLAKHGSKKTKNIEIMSCAQDAFPAPKLEDNISESKENLVVIMLQLESIEMAEDCVSVSQDLLKVKEEIKEGSEVDSKYQ